MISYTTGTTISVKKVDVVSPPITTSEGALLSQSLAMVAVNHANTWLKHYCCI
jgi:hypothetical protein